MTNVIIPAKRPIQAQARVKVQLNLRTIPVIGPKGFSLISRLERMAKAEGLTPEFKAEIEAAIQEAHESVGAQVRYSMDERDENRNLRPRLDQNGKPVLDGRVAALWVEGLMVARTYPQRRQNQRGEWVTYPPTIVYNVVQDHQKMLDEFTAAQPAKALVAAQSSSRPAQEVEIAPPQVDDEQPGGDDEIPF